MSISFAPQVEVDAPARTPRSFGLFSALGFRDDDVRWQNGVLWQGAPDEPAHGIGQPQNDPADTVGLPKTFDAQFSGGSGSTFIIYGNFSCSPVGNSPARAEALAEEHLLAREEARVEQALWTGDLGNIPNFSGANGFDAPANLGEFSDPLMALATLEQWLATTYGSTGTLHMSVSAAVILTAQGLIDARSGRLQTAMGTRVVAGAGYPEGKIIATGALAGYRGDVFSSSDRPGDLLDRDRNDLYAVAEREYVLMVDGGIAEIDYDFNLGGGGVGPAGKSAYEIAVEEGFAGSETEWLASLKGDAGPAPEVTWNGTNIVVDGAQGPDLKGPQGSPGGPGAPGVVQAVVAGDGVTVDDSDPAHPVIGVSE